MAIAVALWLPLALALRSSPPPSASPSAPAAEEVRVVRVEGADEPRWSASSRSVDRTALEATPKRSAEDLLRLLPGLHIVQHGTQGKAYQFYLRGFDAAHGADIETALEGIPLNEPSNVHAHGYLDLTFLIPEVVDEVEIDKGPLRLTQGDFATAGTIRYRLGVRERGTLLRYELGTTRRHRVMALHAPPGRSRGTFVAAEVVRDQGFGENRWSRRASGIGQARLWASGRTHLDLLGAAYGASFGLPGTLPAHDVERGEVGFYDSYTEATAGESARGLAALRLTTSAPRVRGRLTAHLGARRLLLEENFTGDLSFPGIGDRYRQAHEALSPGLRGSTRVAVHPRLDLLAGASWRADFAHQHVDGLRPTGEIWSTRQRHAFAQHAFGGLLGLRTAPWPWLALEAGLRVDVFHTAITDRTAETARHRGTVGAASPRLVAQFLPSPRWQLFLGYGRGLRSPEARAFAAPEVPLPDTDTRLHQGGAPRVTPTDGLEVGARAQPSRLFDLGLAAFGTWIARESVFDHVSGFNVERAGTRRLGLELDAQLRPTPWLGLELDLTYVHGRFEGSGNPIPGAPPLLVSLEGFLAHPKGFRAGLRWFLLGPRPLSYGAEAGVSTVADATIGYRHRWFQFDAAVDNVANARWREGEYHFASHWAPATPRSSLPAIHFTAGSPIAGRFTWSAFF